MKTYISTLVLILIISINTFSQNKITKFEQTIKTGKAKNIKTLIHIKGGQLFIKGGTDNLAHAKLTYNKYDWDPTVSYTEKDDYGKLIIKASTKDEEKHIDDDNKCWIELNTKYNYSLGVVLGVGVADMDFEGFNIEKALFKLGVGSFNINLKNTSLPFLKVEAGIGEANINLSGNYKNNLKAQINAGIGELNITVPDNIGVKFIINGFLGNVETPDYRKHNNEYKNKLYGNTKYSIVIKISGAIGTISIKEDKLY